MLDVPPLCVVTKSQTVKPGKGGAFNNLTVVDVKTKKKKTLRLRSDDKVEKIAMDKASKYSVLYIEGDLVHIMHLENFEQIELPIDLIPEKARAFIVDDMEIKVESFDGEPIVVHLPSTVRMRVEHTVQQVTGATAKVGAFKEGTLENGVKIMMPPFIQTDHEIDVCPVEWTYQGKA